MPIDDRSRAEMRYLSASRTDPGSRRKVNEDRVLENAIEGLWAVADGMGGHVGGAAAAERVVCALATMSRARSGYAKLSNLREALEQVNAGLVADREGSVGKSVSGSTVVALLIHDDHFACIWAGDSRAYLLRAGKLECLTRDHTLVQELVDRGVLSDAEQRGHPQAHVITRAIGASDRLQLDEVFSQVHQGDVFVLCSDGLTGCVTDDEIAGCLEGAGPEVAADELLQIALSRSPADNISLVVVAAA